MDCPTCGSTVACRDCPAEGFGEIGARVHYVARGSADGRFPATCRLAFITEYDPADPRTAGLCVVNPSGLFFHPREMGGVAHDVGSIAPGAVGSRCPLRGRAYAPGTWHYAARTS
jgi:hypothetical protein